MGEIDHLYLYLNLGDWSHHGEFFVFDQHKRQQLPRIRIVPSWRRLSILFWPSEASISHQPPKGNKMSRTQLNALVICFSTICLFPSVGFSQDFYQPQVTYSQPYVSQGYSAQYISNQFPTTSSVSSPIYAYDSLGVSTQSYGGFGGAVVQGTSYQAPVVQAPVGQGQFTQGPGGTLISKDYGYAGPGDMRTHLWAAHRNELQANGVSQGQLNSMPMATVQKWHNFFHGSEGRPQ